MYVSECMYVYYFRTIILTSWLLDAGALSEKPARVVVKKNVADRELYDTLGSHFHLTSHHYQAIHSRNIHRYITHIHIYIWRKEILAYDGRSVLQWLLWLS